MLLFFIFFSFIDNNIIGDNMEEKSIWSSSIKMDEFVKLNKDINTNVLIVGGGISGLLCAYELKKRNIDYILVEKDKIASQISKNFNHKFW